MALFLSVNLNAQAWEQLNSPPFLRNHSNGFGYGGKAFLLEGGSLFDFDNRTSKQMWEYIPETDSWNLLPDFPGQARGIAIGDDWNGKYYYGFGRNANGNVLNDLWEFNPVDTSWVELPSCPCQGRTHPALIAHNDKIFMGSGSTGGGDLKDWWEYDMLTQEWTQKEDMPGTVRHHPFFFGIGDYVYAGGGHVANWLRYDPVNEDWAFIDDLPEGRVAGTQFDYGGKGYVLAGDDTNHNHVPIWQNFMSYDPVEDEWQDLPPVPNEQGRWAPSSFIIGNEIYLVGGESETPNGFQSNSTVWKMNLDLLSCLPPDGLNATNVDDISAELFWVTNAGQADTLKYRPVGSLDWSIVVNPKAVLVLNDLESCTEYEFIVGGGCGDELSYSEPFFFTTEGCVSSSSDITNDELQMAVFPNPAEDFIVVKGDELSLGIYHLKLVNSTGELVRTIGDYRLGDRIDLSLLSRGVYFLYVENDDVVKTLKLICN